MQGSLCGAGTLRSSSLWKVLQTGSQAGGRGCRWGWLHPAHSSQPTLSEGMLMLSAIPSRRVTALPICTTWLHWLTDSHEGVAASLPAALRLGPPRSRKFHSAYKYQGPKHQLMLAKIKI